MAKNKSTKTVKDVLEKAKNVISKKDGEIRLLKTELLKANGEKTVTFKMPDTVEVRNFPEIMKVQVQNPAEPVKAVSILNLKDIKFPPQKDVVFPKVQDVRVINESAHEKASSWVPEVVKTLATSIVGGLAKRLDMGVLMKMDPEDKLLPQAVILVDTKGRPVNMNSQPIMIPMPNSPGGNPPPTRIGAGHLSLTTTAQKLSATIIVCRKVIITALATNAGAVYIGDSSVNYLSGSETGAMLTPTGSVTIDIDDLSKVYAIAENNGDIISFTYQR